MNFTQNPKAEPPCICQYPLTSTFPQPRSGLPSDDDAEPLTQGLQAGPVLPALLCVSWVIATLRMVIRLEELVWASGRGHVHAELDTATNPHTSQPSSLTALRPTHILQTTVKASTWSTHQLTWGKVKALDRGALSSHLPGQAWGLCPRGKNCLRTRPPYPLHSGDSSPFDDAVVVLEVRRQHLHLPTELLHAVQGQAREAVVVKDQGRPLPRPFLGAPSSPTAPPSLIPASRARQGAKPLTYTHMLTRTHPLSGTYWRTRSFSVELG